MNLRDVMDFGPNIGLPRKSGTPYAARRRRTGSSSRRIQREGAKS